MLAGIWRRLESDFAGARITQQLIADCLSQKDPWDMRTRLGVYFVERFLVTGNAIRWDVRYALETDLESIKHVRNSTSVLILVSWEFISLLRSREPKSLTIRTPRRRRETSIRMEALTCQDCLAAMRYYPLWYIDVGYKWIKFCHMTACTFWDHARIHNVK